VQTLLSSAVGKTVLLCQLRFSAGKFERGYDANDHCAQEEKVSWSAGAAVELTINVPGSVERAVMFSRIGM
jgi:hypothetical protein